MKIRKDKPRRSSSSTSISPVVFDEDDEALSKDALNSLKLDLFKPEDFLTANEKIATLSLDLLEKIYDLSKSSENNGSLDDPLGLQTESLKFKLKKKKKNKQRSISKAEAPVPKLITQDFDEDQIWEEVEIQNRFMFENLVSSVSKLLAYQTKPLEGDSEVESVSENEDEEQEVTLDHEGNDDEDQEQDDSDFFESDEKYKKRDGGSGKKYPKSVVDDKFFSLAQMTEYIEQIEAEEEKPKKSEDDNESLSDGDDEESVDMFDMPSEEEEEKGEDGYFYQDFFDPPMENQDKDNQHEGVQLEQYESLKKQISRFDLRNQREGESEEPGENEESSEEDANKNPEDEEEDDDDEDNQELRNKLNTTLSAFEKRKLQIEENIEEIENEALQPKSWHLLGEATGKSRPENALLEEHLIYDHLIRPAPAITIETTLKLEDVIKNRIKDNAWDDVERKIRPVEDPREYKKRLVLDAEKSKASLAEIYEKEYLEQKKLEDGETEEKEPEEHVKIRNDLKTLFQKLDSLSHFHFTPKQPPPEVKIISNAPSISIEETGGVNVSDANMLAPQEIQDHAKGLIKGHDERSDTDRKRERRKKKKKQHLKRLMQEEKARLKGLGLRNIKLAEGIVKSQKAGKIVDGYSTSNQTAKELKSSKAFFSKLQQSVTSHIDKVANRKRASNAKDPDRDKLSAKKFKL